MKSAVYRDECKNLIDHDPWTMLKVPLERRIEMTIQDYIKQSHEMIDAMDSELVTWGLQDQLSAADATHLWFKLHSLTLKLHDIKLSAQERDGWNDD